MHSEITTKFFLNEDPTYQCDHMTAVDYWHNVQFLHGGPKSCPDQVKHKLRLAKSRYKREIRVLKREISANVADHATSLNCYRVIFTKPQYPTDQHLRLLTVVLEMNNRICGEITS